MNLPKICDKKMCHKNSDLYKFGTTRPRPPTFGSIVPNLPFVYGGFPKQTTSPQTTFLISNNTFDHNMTHTMPEKEEQNIFTFGESD